MDLNSPCFHWAPSAVCLWVAVGLGLWLAFRHLGFKSRISTKLPPGPRGLEATLGIVRGMLDGSFNQVADALSAQYGPLVLSSSPLGDLCFVNSAELVRQLYGSRLHETATCNRPRCFLGWFAFHDFKDVVVSSPNIRPEWPKMRRLFHRALKFYGDGVDHMERTVQAELRQLVRELDTTCGQDVDLHTALTHSVTRLVLLLVSGHAPDQWLVDTALQVDHYSNQLFSPITNTVLTGLPWLRFIPGMPYRKICSELLRTRDILVDELFTKAKVSHVAGDNQGMISTLLDEQSKETAAWLTDNHVTGIVLNTIAAAQLTTTQTLKGLLLYLTHHPDVASRTQREVDLHVPPHRQPCLADRSSCPFLQAVVLETLRLTSPVSLGLPHLITEELELGGYTLPKGATVFTNTHVFHRDPDLYPDPEVFRPDRFLDDDGQLLPPDSPVRKGLVPFGVGTRSCPGENFARSRIFLYVATLLRHFHFLPPKDHAFLPAARSSWNNGVVLELKPYHVMLRQRSPSNQGGLDP